MRSLLLNYLKSIFSFDARLNKTRNSLQTLPNIYAPNSFLLLVARPEAPSSLLLLLVRHLLLEAMHLLLAKHIRPNLSFWFKKVLTADLDSVNQSS